MEYFGAEFTWVAAATQVNSAPKYHAGMAAHTHDDVDWAARLAAMRRYDDLDRQANVRVAERLGADLPKEGTVVDVGPGAGGMSALFGELLSRAGGGTIVLVDAVPELLDAAADAVRASVDDPGAVSIETVRADAAAEDIADLLPRADLLWASGVVHHLPDQQAALNRLAGIVRGGGVLGLAEGGLDGRCLPRDVGVGEPGLEERLLAAREVWFRKLRGDMDGSVRMPYGWSRGLSEAGLESASSFSYLVDHPAPPTPLIREYVVDRLAWYSDNVAEWLSADDRAAVARLLDESDSDYVGARDDVFLLLARTVHYGWQP